uniref:Ankyrin repeat domain-containing protein n=1 Tax=Guillardia theta TaxID=55529 RepID=A0A7S4NPV0_GUITH|mmetsp:Transcript_28973/g.93345  ORF Transcript_28973/g.93345 Transcript_28973/m.93345 type:complete len:188 (+) Transcript_28973:194-757(+)
MKQLSIVLVLGWLLACPHATASVELDGHAFLDAVARGEEQAVNEMLSSGINPDQVLTPSGETAVHLAALSGNLNILHALLQAGANVNVITTGSDGLLPIEKRTPLMWFASSCQVDGVQALVDAGARADIENENGQTVLALIQNHVGDECAKVRKILQVLSCKFEQQLRSLMPCIQELEKKAGSTMKQ